MAKRHTVTSREDRESSAMSGQPWYVKTMVWVGAPTVAAGYLLWWVLSTLSGQQAQHHVATLELQKAISSMTSEVSKSHAEDVAQAQSAQDSAWAQLSVMQRICLNTAKTDADRIACASLTGRTRQP